MHRLFIITFCVLFLCTSVASMAHALGLAENIQLHGFASQGYIRSHNNNFLVHSRSGSIKMTDVGLDLNWRPFQSLRIGVQGYYRNLGDYNENRVVLDWGVVDYQPWDIFGVRAGKIKMPLGLYNEVRDSPFLLPMVFLPQSIYDESRRDSNLAYIGLGVYGNLPVVHMAMWIITCSPAKQMFLMKASLNKTTKTRPLRPSIAITHCLPKKRTPYYQAATNLLIVKVMICTVAPWSTIRPWGYASVSPFCTVRPASI